MAVRLSALRVGHHLPHRKIPGTRFCYRLSRPQGHSAAGRIRWTEKIHLIGTRSRNLPACSTVSGVSVMTKINGLKKYKPESNREMKEKQGKKSSYTWVRFPAVTNSVSFLRCQLIVVTLYLCEYLPIFVLQRHMFNFLQFIRCSWSIRHYFGTCSLDINEM
jgi:hypothetical protein